MNPFESGVRRVIPAVLIYVRCPADVSEAPSVGLAAGVEDEILMIQRDGSKREQGGAPDYHRGKWNGLGGKLELDESPLQAAKRELFEESGLDLSEEAFRALGVLQFPNFKAHKNEDWLCWVVTARIDSSLRKIPLHFKAKEGVLHWVPVSEMTKLPLWPGDLQFLPMVLEEKPFMGTFWYRGQDLLRFQVTPFSLNRSARFSGT